MQIRLASLIQPDSILDGEGIRTVIWTQGCSHNCLGCHNPATHDFDGGISVEIDALKEEISKLIYQDGITLSGGDPFFQAKACAEVAAFAHECDLDVWCYTGFTFEELMNMTHKNKSVLNLLENIDVLVDGRFMLDKKSLDIPFRGSTNQRIIDVKESLKCGQVVEIEKYIYHQRENPSYSKHVFV